MAAVDYFLKNEIACTSEAGGQEEGCNLVVFTLTSIVPIPIYSIQYYPEKVNCRDSPNIKSV